MATITGGEVFSDAPPFLGVLWGLWIIKYAKMVIVVVKWWNAGEWNLLMGRSYITHHQPAGARKTPRLQAEGEVEQPPLERSLEWWWIEGAIWMAEQSRFIPWNQGAFLGSSRSRLGQTNQARSFPGLARRDSSSPNLPMAEWAGEWNPFFLEDHFANCFTEWPQPTFEYSIGCLLSGKKSALTRSCWLSESVLLRGSWELIFSVWWCMTRSYLHRHFHWWNLCFGLSQVCKNRCAPPTPQSWEAARHPRHLRSVRRAVMRCSDAVMPKKFHMGLWVKIINPRKARMNSQQNQHFLWSPIIVNCHKTKRENTCTVQNGLGPGDDLFVAKIGRGTSFL